MHSKPVKPSLSKLKKALVSFASHGIPTAQTLNPKDLSSFVMKHFPNLNYFVQSIQKNLKLRGYAQIKDLDFGEHDGSEALFQYTLLACLMRLGEPYVQDGARFLWPVSPIDTPHKTYSVTYTEASAHHDGITVEPFMPPLVALFGVRSSHGGETYLKDFERILNAVAKTPEGRRHLGILKSEYVNIQRPAIFTKNGRSVTKRLRIIDEHSQLYWRDDMITYESVSAELLLAISYLQNAIVNAPVIVSLKIQPGTLFVWRQDRFVHGRTAFHPDPTHPRLLYRWWGRPLLS